MMLLRENLHVWLGSTKTWNLRIGTVCIGDLCTDPSLIYIILKCLYSLGSFGNMSNCYIIIEDKILKAFNVLLHFVLFCFKRKEEAKTEAQSGTGPENCETVARRSLCRQGVSGTATKRNRLNAYCFHPWCLGGRSGGGKKFVWAVSQKP